MILLTKRCLEGVAESKYESCVGVARRRHRRNHPPIRQSLFEDLTTQPQISIFGYCHLLFDT